MAIWPWGDGDWPNKLAHRFDTVLADDAFACGLARLSGARLEAAPHAFDGMRDVPGRRVLVSLTVWSVHRNTAMPLAGAST